MSIIGVMSISESSGIRRRRSTGPSSSRVGSATSSDAMIEGGNSYECVVTDCKTQRPEFPARRLIPWEPAA